jgi:hypothetical protein
MPARQRILATNRERTLHQHRLRHQCCIPLQRDCMYGHLMKELPMSRWTQWGLTGIISMGCMYVSDVRPNDGTKLTILSASAAVVARIPYLHNYKSPEFLCKLLFF